MTPLDYQTWAERLIEIKKILSEKWHNISDEVALKIIWILDSEILDNDEKFNEFLEFGFSLYLILLDDRMLKASGQEELWEIENKKWESMEIRDCFPEHKIYFILRNDNLTTLADLFEKMRTSHNGWKMLAITPSIWLKKMAYIYFQLSLLEAPNDILNSVYDYYKNGEPSKFKDFQRNIELLQSDRQKL